MLTYADVCCRTLTYAGEIVLVICEDKGDVAAFKDFVPAGPLVFKRNLKKNAPVCVLIRCSYGCPHTPIASACSYFCPHTTMCPDTTDVAALKDFGPAGRTHCYVSSYYLLYMRPHFTKCVQINSSRAGPSTHTRTHAHTHTHTPVCVSASAHAHTHTHQHSSVSLETRRVHALLEKHVGC